MEELIENENLLDELVIPTGEEQPGQESLIDNLELDFNVIPEQFTEEQSSLSPMISERDDIDIGLTLEDYKDMISYIQGTGPKPDFIDKMTADAEGRLKNIVYIMNFSELSKLPTLIALQSQIRERLFAPENLYSMDTKELTAASANLSKEIQTTLDSALRTMQTVNQFGSLNNDYRNLIDRLLTMPEEKLNRIKEIVYRED